MRIIPITTAVLLASFVQGALASINIGRRSDGPRKNIRSAAAVALGHPPSVGHSTRHDHAGGSSTPVLITETSRATSGLPHDDTNGCVLYKLFDIYFDLYQQL